MSATLPSDVQGAMCADECPCVWRMSVHQLDPRTRILASVLFSLSVSWLQSGSGLISALSVAALAVAWAQIPAPRIAKHIVALDGFMVVVLCSLPFSVPGQEFATVLGAHATYEGLWQAVALILKINAISLVIFALITTMQPLVMASALTGLHVPRALVHLFIFTLRGIDLLHREQHRLRDAMRARAFRLRFSLHCWRSIGFLFGMLMVRSLERAERMLEAMRCRGFRGEFPMMAVPQVFKGIDYVFLCGSLVVCAGLWSFGL